jgi:hypothetical protein
MKAKRNKRHRGRVRELERLAAVRVRAMQLLAAVGQVELAARSPRVARALDRTAGKVARDS